MEPIARQQILTWWNDAWREGLWAASWEKSLDGLTAHQAAWSPVLANAPTPPPAPAIHSIWQNVLHMIFWRESWLRRISPETRGQHTTPQEVAAGNFPVITEVSEAAWQQAKDRFLATQQRVAAALADPSLDVVHLPYLLPHDCYHFGQINLLRAMLGFKHIE